MQQPDFLPDLATLARAVGGQPPNVRELFQYALVSLMIEDGKAEIIDRQVIDERGRLTGRIKTPEIFSIVKPDVGEELLADFREMAREVLQEDRET